MIIHRLPKVQRLDTGTAAEEKNGSYWTETNHSKSYWTGTNYWKSYWTGTNYWKSYWTGTNYWKSLKQKNRDGWFRTMNAKLCSKLLDVKSVTNSSSWELRRGVVLNFPKACMYVCVFMALITTLVLCARSQDLVMSMSVRRYMSFSWLLDLRAEENRVPRHQRWAWIWIWTFSDRI